MSRRKPLQSGTSLLEIMVAIVFLAVCVVPMLRMVSSTQTRGNDARARSIALTIAQDEIDKRRTAAKQAAPTPGTTTQTLNSVPGLVDPASVTVITRANPGMPKLFDISVDVEFGSPRTHTTLTTKVKSP